MAAALLAHAKEIRDDGFIVEMVVWELPEPLPPCRHRYKYRLFFGTGDRCWVRIHAVSTISGSTRSCSISRWA
ncbi:hypothetical protein CKO40_13450 [Halochromatium glycolicum]|uniref:Uncharacterized protein n=1 Tax=Halochromatium glycolicum TaxID=85075 RepID=A0AAJ0XAW1_9GAMM|nr:hypothetical protein [Halochromatium glycolicum]